MIIPSYLPDCCAPPSAPMISKAKSGLANATALIGGALNDAKQLFQDKGKNDLDVYLHQIDNENVEHMALQGDFDELRDCSPSYEQLSADRIIDQINKNLAILKSLEAILEERLQAFSVFFNTLNKTRASFEAFQLAEGSVKHALDAFFVYEEQELQQARQQVCLGDLRKFITEIKVDVQKRHLDYQRSLSVAENEISSSEKRLLKAKETLDKYYSVKHKLETDTTAPMKSSMPTSPKPARSTSGSSPAHPSEERSERLREVDDLILKQERETKEFARNLLQMIAEKDKVACATRRAYQQLNREVLESIDVTLQKIHARESESHGAKTVALEKLGIAVTELNTTHDEEQFIANYCGSDSLVLSSQALSILGDIQLMEEQKRELENTVVTNTTSSSTSSNGDTISIDDIEEPVTSTTFSSAVALACLSEIFNYTAPAAPEASPTTPKELLEESFSSSDSKCLKAVRCLAHGSSTLEGRKIFVSALNQFRSKKVNVGVGAMHLSAALWALLDKCKQHNDVHNGKIIMMLSQTFYTVVVDEAPPANTATTPTRRESIGSDDTPMTRVYLKESLVRHPIWSEGWFWEQALWQCVLEQLQMLQYTTPWYEMSKEDRHDAILRVHDVIFSQVMAIAHSMVELGCSRSNVREFIYRMCCIHQLSEAQRHQLLQHTSRNDHAHATSI